MWRQLCRRHVQLHLLLLLLSLFVVAWLSSNILPGNTKNDNDRSSYSDRSSHGSEGDLSIQPHRVRRNVAIDVAEDVADAVGGSNRTLYIVTATYPRPEQEAELLRLSQTLMHVRPLVFWVLVEDARRKTPAVTELLQRSRLRHVHLLGT